MWRSSRRWPILGSRPQIEYEGIHRYRVARHNTPVMFLNGLDFPVNFLNPGLANATIMHRANTRTANTHLSWQTSCGSYSVMCNEVSRGRSRTVSHVLLGVCVCVCVCVWERWRVSDGWSCGNNVKWPDWEHEDCICPPNKTTELSVSPFRRFFFFFFILQKQKREDETWRPERLRQRTKVEQNKEEKIISPH